MEETPRVVQQQMQPPQPQEQQPQQPQQHGPPPQPQDVDQPRQEPYRVAYGVVLGIVHLISIGLLVGSFFAKRVFVADSGPYGSAPTYLNFFDTSPPTVAAAVFQIAALVTCFVGGGVAVTEASLGKIVGHRFVSPAILGLATLLLVVTNICLGVAFGETTAGFCNYDGAEPWCVSTTYKAGPSWILTGVAQGFLFVSFVSVLVYACMGRRVLVRSDSRVTRVPALVAHSVAFLALLVGLGINKPISRRYGNDFSYFDRGHRYAATYAAAGTFHVLALLVALAGTVFSFVELVKNRTLGKRSFSIVFLAVPTAFLFITNMLLVSGRNDNAVGLTWDIVIGVQCFLVLALALQIFIVILASSGDADYVQIHHEGYPHMMSQIAPQPFGSGTQPTVAHKTTTASAPPLAAGYESVDPVQATLKHCSRAVSILTIIAHSACVVLLIVAFGLNQVASVQTWYYWGRGDRDYFSGRSCTKALRYSGMIFQLFALATCIAGIVVAAIETGTRRYLWKRHLSLCIMACAWVFLLVASICLGVVENVYCDYDDNRYALGNSTIIVIFTTCFLFVCVVARLVAAICRQRAMRAHHIVTSQHQSAPDGITSAPLLTSGDSDGSVEPMQATLKQCSRAVSILTIIAHSACVVLLIVAFGLNQVASVQTWYYWGRGDRDYFSGRSCTKGLRYSGMVFQFFALATCTAGIVVASIETGTRRYLWKRHLSLCIMACACTFLLVASICLGVVKNVSCYGDYNHHTLGNSTIIVIFTTCFLFVCVVARLVAAICRQRAMRAHLTQAERQQVQTQNSGYAAYGSQAQTYGTGYGGVGYQVEQQQLQPAQQQELAGDVVVGTPVQENNHNNQSQQAPQQQQQQQPPQQKEDPPTVDSVL